MGNMRATCRALLFAAIITLPSESFSVEILNSATLTPPCADNVWITWSGPFALYIPTGLDSGSAVARCDRPLSGTSKPYARSYISSVWPSAGNKAFARANSGMGFDGFVPNRVSQYVAEFDVTFSGQAALYVPQAPDFWGGADAILDIRVVVSMHEMVLGLPATTWEWEFPIVDNVSTQHGTPSWVWNERRIFASGPLTLEPGRTYAAAIDLFCYTEANTVGTSGGGTAWVNFENPLLAQGFIVHSVTVRNLSPDLTGPVASLGQLAMPPGQHCLAEGASGFVPLEADDGDGFGVESIFYRINGGNVLTYSSPLWLGPGVHHLEYWATDRVANEGPHELADYVLDTVAAAPVQVGVPDGSGPLWQPVTLQWNPALNATSYRIQVDDDPAFGTPEVDLITGNLDAQVQDLSVETTFYWRVLSLNGCGEGSWSPVWSFATDITTAVADDTAVDVPTRHVLLQNSPNPFNPRTVIRFGLAHEEDVTLRVYSLTGQLVRTLAKGRWPAGFHEIQWDGSDEGGRPLASGVYLYQVAGADFEHSRKMVLLR